MACNLQVVSIKLMAFKQRLPLSLRWTREMLLLMHSDLLTWNSKLSSWADLKAEGSCYTCATSYFKVNLQNKTFFGLLIRITSFRNSSNNPNLQLQSCEFNGRFVVRMLSNLYQYIPVFYQKATHKIQFTKSKTFLSWWPENLQLIVFSAIL